MKLASKSMKIPSAAFRCFLQKNFVPLFSQIMSVGAWAFLKNKG